LLWERSCLRYSMGCTSTRRPGSQGLICLSFRIRNLSTLMRAASFNNLTDSMIWVSSGASAPAGRTSTCSVLSPITTRHRVRYSFGSLVIHTGEAVKTSSLVCVVYVLLSNHFLAGPRSNTLNPAIAYRYRLTEPTYLRGTSVPSVPDIRPRLKNPGSREPLTDSIQDNWINVIDLLDSPSHPSLIECLACTTAATAPTSSAAAARPRRPMPC
jgi:hypothetical protein